MKMVDAWLLFNLLYPFIVVLLHTYMDTLRNDDDREINHHGKTITINDDTEDNNDETDGKIMKVIYTNKITAKRNMSSAMCSPALCKLSSCRHAV